MGQEQKDGDRLKVLSLDADGVIFDSMPNQFDWLKWFHADSNAPFEWEEFNNDFIEYYNKTIRENGFPALYHPDTNYEKRKKKIGGLYEEWKNEYPPEAFLEIPLIIKDIRNLSRPSAKRTEGLRIVLTTNSSMASLETALLNSDLFELFDDAFAHEFLVKRVGIENANKYMKPNNYVFQEMMNKYGIVNPRQIMHIGDTPDDIKATRRLVVPESYKNKAISVAVTWGFETEEELAKHKPDETIDKHMQLFDVVEKYGGF